MKKALILLAGGSGKRFNISQKIPKQFINYDSTNLIEHFLFLRLQDNLDNFLLFYQN